MSRLYRVQVEVFGEVPVELGQDAELARGKEVAKIVEFEINDESGFPLDDRPNRYGYEGERSLAGGASEREGHDYLKSRFADPIVNPHGLKLLATRWECIEYSEWDFEFDEEEDEESEE